MKKAFSMIELIVAMLILAFVFSVVPMILATTFANTKIILNQDKAIKLGELYSVIKLLPYQGAQNSNDIYSKNSNFVLKSQDRVNYTNLANEFLGDSDKFLIRASNNRQKDYIGKNQDIQTDNYTFTTGLGKEIKFELNSHSISKKSKWDLKISNDTILKDDITVVDLTIVDDGDTKDDTKVSVKSYFANTGRASTNFYNELLPFEDENNSIASIYEQQLKNLGITIK